MKHKNFFPIILFIIFIVIAITLWITTCKTFYLFNFIYIGSVVFIGLILLTREYRYARLFVQVGVGLYMLIYLGIILGENMQIEGFFYYLLLGVFQAAYIHYLVAKIAGPLIFGRGWCGYACWTTMILDLLPYKTPQKPRIEKLQFVRYIVFIVSFFLVAALFIFDVSNLGKVMNLMFIVGNVVYYFVGIVLAIILKDNRAFCKYICPVTVLIKPASYFSLTRIKVDKDKCINCKRCIKTCPMNVDMLNPKRKRKNGTECILCLECLKVCPKRAIKV
ncbi:hypothetical protein CLROS_007980 [Clostridium felsineum]|uniref:Uncharacterized protein n=2 Tax=Clostridium felsineum TaxID=36839 RepID=A0A1S8KYC5_9CLOT|nr:4Fe-4S binding protein [Clostridium felsineum]URZ05472.1 hypothetical protein CLROS_007980 [Clostridium felsineum]URZ10512.1 hypothetical protein CROST_012220 [Clostridium felsineum]